MNGELLTVLDQIEREKGIKKEVLIDAVEAALASAAKKTSGIKAEEVSVKVDPSTGDIKVFCSGNEVASEDFGRIAAQTAKQVIIQKIREAERDVIFSEYQARVDTIISGMVHRFEKGNIIVDLGKTEAIFPRKEQIPRESYKQGDRIRGYVLEVKRTGKGPQIILSRTHPGLVKRLFELEVPEISDGIVEIKAIAREAGDRTKIAVWSKEEKVDCVGACVGMRGSRVKNVVKDLHGEKIDIVRWSEELKDYIAASLSPAKIEQIKIDKEAKKVEVVVEDDQLSLAIGKKGQNVRLAVKLTKMDIDIKSRAVLVPQVKISVEELPRIGPKTYQTLVEAGFDKVEKLASAKEEDLAKLQGIGKKSAQNIIKSASEILKKAQKPSEIRPLQGRIEEKPKELKDEPKEKESREAQPKEDAGQNQELVSEEKAEEKEAKDKADEA